MQEEKTLSLSIDFRDKILDVKIDQSTTLEELYNYLKHYFGLKQEFENFRFYSKTQNKCYSGKDTTLNQDEKELSISFQYDEEKMIRLQISMQVMKLNRLFVSSFSENSNYQDLEEAILNYLGKRREVSQVDLFLFNSPLKRNITLKELQIKNDYPIVAKLRYTGG